MQNLIQILLLLLIINKISAATTDVRIVGGRLALNGEFPYQVSLRRSYNDRHSCGGAIITSKHILTAAHCMYYGWGGQLPPFIVSVVMGQLQLPTNSLTTYRNATNLFIHPEYNKQTLANDIAIIELDKEIPNNNLISKIPLNRRNTAANTSCVVSGWGVLESGSTTLSTKLLATYVFSIDFNKCQKRYNVGNITLSKGMICAVNDYKPADACQGDSGGPLVCNGRLTGVVSTGLGCGNNSFPGIYSDVQYFLPWIIETIGTNFTLWDESTTILVPTVNTIAPVETWNILDIFSSSALRNIQTVVMFVVALVVESFLL